MSRVNADDHEQDYIKRRGANQAFWADKAQLHGSSLSATASTGWVRAGTLRRLRRILRPTDRILEIGCGNGNLLATLGRQCRAMGMDLTTEMLQVAAKAHGTAIRGLARADAAWVPFREASFDVVYTSRCLINLQNPEMQAAALREVLRVVKPGGTVVLSENFQEPVDRLNRVKARFGSGPLELDHHNLRLDLPQTLAVCRERGWAATRIEGFPMTSFVAHVVIGRLTRRRGGRVAQRLSGPLLGLLARLDDGASRWLPHFGKDTTITLRRTTARG